LNIRKEFNIALRQKLCLVLLDRNFNSKVLVSKHFNSKIAFCVPNQWVNILSKYCRINKIATSVKFYFFLIFYGIKSIYKNIVWFWELFNFKTDADLKSKAYVSFNDLLYSNLPIEGNVDSNTIIDWHFDHYIQGEHGIVVAHNLKRERYIHKNIEIVEELTYLSSLSVVEKFKMCFYFIYIVFLSTCLLLLGRWEYIFMINDILKSKFYQDIDSKLLAKEYFFSYSSLDYRPLWTYIAANRGSKITFWAYASSLSGIKKNDGEYVFTDYAWEISTWPNILVFTKQFKDYLKKIVLYPSKFLLSDTPIANTDAIFPSILLDKIKDKIVLTMFDVSSASDFNAALLLHNPKFRTFANGKKFISDICEVFNDDKFFIIFKIKRPIKKSYLFDTSYFDYLEEVTRIYGNVFLCHGDISAEKLIRLSELCISMPFTSTAFIASMINVKSVFYDGSGKVRADDTNSQGIELIRGKNELIEYKNKFLNAKS
jgi:polysaccharide biosynthesis PFTS motif protein